MSTVARANTLQTPNYWRRRLIAGALGLTVLAGAGNIGKNFIDNSRRNALVEQLAAEGPRAVANFNDGKDAGEDVVKVIAKHGGQAFEEALAITPNDQHPEDTAGVIEAEAGATVDPGETLILPKDLVKPEYRQPNPGQ